MALGQIYTTGTVTVTNGSATVTGAGVIWNDVIDGDTLQVGATQAFVLSVNPALTQITLKAPWAGANAAGAAYMILKNSWLRYDPAITQTVLREFLTKMAGAGIIYAVTGESPDPGVGKDGDYALKTNEVPWTLWLKVAGVWEEQGDFGGGGGGGGATIVVSDTPPPTPVDNTLWWESDSGKLYVRYNDGVGAAQWVEAVAVPTVDTSLFAAPLDALAYNGMQINGSMEVSQENGATNITVPSSVLKYIVDGWAGFSFGVQAPSGGVQGSGPPGFPSCIQFYVSTGNPSPGVGDYAGLIHLIEGYRTSRLAWGTSSAVSLSLGFWVWTKHTGLHSVAVRNGTSDRTFIATYTVNAVSTWEYKTITVPGCLDGTWNTNNGIGIRLNFTLMCGSSGLAAPGTWYNASYLAAIGQVNGVAAANDAMQITGVVVLPGTQVPTAAQSPLIMRPLDQELLTCKRYWQSLPNTLVNPIAMAPYSIAFPVQMRTTPTISGGGAGFSAANPSASMVTIYQTTQFYQTLILDARL